MTLTLEFDTFFENFNLAINFWTVSARALIFNMSIPCDKTFPGAQLLFILWPWLPIFFYPVTLTWSFTHFLKTLTLLITFEYWVLQLLYSKWVFLVIWPWSLTHFLEDFNLANNFRTASARSFIFHMSISCDKTFPWFHYFWHCMTLTLEFDPFFKNFNLAYNF